jgi:hypothetical protein
VLPWSSLLRRLTRLRGQGIFRLFPVLLVIAMVGGRLSSTIAPFAALFAPVVCTVCHGCPVTTADEERHAHAGPDGERLGGHVCDCESCERAAEAIAEGRGQTMLRDAPHGAGHDATALAQGFALAPDPPRVVVALCVLEDLPIGARVWSPLATLEPAVPPPRRATT